MSAENKLIAQSKELIEHLKKTCYDKRLKNFTIDHAIQYKERLNHREQVILEAYHFICSNPLWRNDYFKYINYYFNTGKKLNPRYFKHDINKLEGYYSQMDKTSLNPFKKPFYIDYVFFMFLKLKGAYNESDNQLFNVTFSDNREYNPLTKIPSVLRGELPFKVKEYDIVRAFPSFIDIEINADFRKVVYEKIDKTQFSTFLNSNVNTNLSIEKIHQGLFPVYNDRVSEIVTLERYNEKGKVFRDLTRYEMTYIERFVETNKIRNYVRLHDGVFVLDEVNCEVLEFDKIEFAIKPCIKPEIINSIKPFYELDAFGKIITNEAIYSSFFKQENFIRISDANDKIQLLRNSNNIIDFFNHKTDIVSFLEGEINDVNRDEIKIRIARDNKSIIPNSFTLLKPTKLFYYKDSNTSFGLPFKNGFHYIEKGDGYKVHVKEYKDVKGFFSPHQIQEVKFNYLESEIGNFERFIQRIATGKKENFDNNDLDLIDAFNSMIGYLCHNYKSPGNSPAIVLTDDGTTENGREGQRGKSLIGMALKSVTKTLIKGGKEFNSSYIHNFADLDASHNIYLIDDIPANFNFHDLYTNVTSDINVQLKGLKGYNLEFQDCPKFLITSNFILKCQPHETSTFARFYEYKVKRYYSPNFTPRDEFKQTFFNDWDATEWNKFYSYVFNCVKQYLIDGLRRIEYDKSDDNYNVMFNSDVKESETKRILNELIDNQQRSFFNVSDFLSIYNQFDNPFKQDKIFKHLNTRDCINTYLDRHYPNMFTYKTDRKWYKLK